MSLHFAKSTVDLSGVMEKLHLPQRVAKIIGSEVVFLVGEKIIDLDLDRVVGSERQTPGNRLPSPRR